MFQCILAADCQLILQLNCDHLALAGLAMFQLDPNPPPHSPQNKTHGETVNYSGLWTVVQRLHLMSIPSSQQSLDLIHLVSKNIAVIRVLFVLSHVGELHIGIGEDPRLIHAGPHGAHPCVLAGMLSGKRYPVGARPAVCQDAGIVRGDTEVDNESGPGPGPVSHDFYDVAYGMSDTT